MKRDDLFAEKEADKVFRTGGVGSCQSSDCSVVKVMTVSSEAS